MLSVWSNVSGTGPGKLDDINICTKILKDLEDGSYDIVHAGTPCNTWSIVRHQPSGPTPLSSRADPYGTYAPTTHREYDTLQTHNHLFEFTMAAFELAVNRKIPKDMDLKTLERHALV